MPSPTTWIQRWAWSLAGVLILLLTLSCGEAPAENAAQTSSSAPSNELATNEPVDAGMSFDEEPQTTVVFLGDSLTAGYGLDEDQAFPALIDSDLQQLGIRVRVVNAGVSGDTTAGGLRRLPWLLRQEPDLVVLALGANDGLRGLPLDDSEKNLREIIRLCQDAGAGVILAGMKVPPNYGPDYAERFESMFPLLSAEYELPLIDFLLEGVAGLPDLNQADGIHPNAEGQQLTAENVLPSLLEALERLGLSPDLEEG